MRNVINFLQLKRSEFLYKVLPINIYLKLKFERKLGIEIDVDNPKRFSEKILCLIRIYEREQKDIIQRCYDKFTVRDYIIEKLGESWSKEILNELYGVYDSVEQIDFDNLPNQFVIKVTQSCGWNIICPDKTKLNIEEAKQKLNKWLKEAKEPPLLEQRYVYNGAAKLICEKYLQESNGSVPSDIRVYCFNGEARLFVIDFGTTERDGRHGNNIVRNVYDLDWNLINVDLGRPHNPSYVMEKPKNLENIISIAETLSKDFYFVRVDLYNINGRDIKFGELTWIPMGGNCLIKPLEYDYEFGKWLTIPKL